MQIFLLILFGFVSGIVGGMGMGGGTLLVPLMSFLNIPQKTVQATNLLSFVPMCAAALALHFKNGLINTSNYATVTLPAVDAAVVGAVVAGDTADKTLRAVFGVFLIAVGLWQIIVAVSYSVKRSKSLTVLSCPCGKLKCRKTGKKSRKNAYVCKNR